MTKETQSPWPRMKPSGEGPRAPNACYLHPDGKLRSDRGLAGPLRLGTEPRIGPKGAPDPGGSDFGMDYISPRRFDPMGTHDVRAPVREASELISREVRKYGGRGSK